jgi:TolB protein
VPQNHSLALDPKSSTFAFSGRIDSPNDGDIYLLDVDGTNLRRLTSAPANEYSPSWSPARDAIVFRSAPSSDPAQQGPSDIAVVRIADLTVRFLTHDAQLGNWSPAWSPTGEWIAYYSGGPDGPGLYLIHPDGSGRHLILEGDAEYPSWSPDSRRIVFMSLGFPAGSSSNDYDLYVVDVDGRNLQRLTNRPGEDGWPAWSNGGDRIVYTHRDSENAPDQLHVMDADGSGDVAITSTDDGLGYSSPSWSPSDTYIAFSAYGQGEEASSAGGMFVMHPDGTNRLQVLGDGVGPVWQPPAP